MIASWLLIIQAQLSQTLFTQPFPSIPNNEQSIPRYRNVYSQPCNTPITRTPSASFSRGPPTPRRRSSVASRPSVDETVREGDESMEEDERMVEDILMSSSPISTNAPISTNVSPSQFAFSNHPPNSGANHTISLQPQLSTQVESPPNSSTFTCTDPFYIAQLQASNSVPQSLFAQTARPPQHSPFLNQHGPHNQDRREKHAHLPPLQLDTNSVSLGAPYNC
jgi:hypothetical protein